MPHGSRGAQAAARRLRPRSGAASRLLQLTGVTRALPLAVSRWQRCAGGSRVPVPCRALPQGQVRLVLPDLVSTRGSKMRLSESRACSHPTEPAAFLPPCFSPTGSPCRSPISSPTVPPGWGWRIPRVCPETLPDLRHPSRGRGTQSQTCFPSAGQILPQLGHTSHTHRAALALTGCSIQSDSRFAIPC